MHKKKTILFDATLLCNALHNNSGRSGIFFVAYNIAKQLVLDNRIKLYFYCDVSNTEELKQCISSKLTMFKHVKIWPSYSKWFLANYLDKFYELKKYCKKNNFTFVRFILHIYTFVLKVLFYTPHKITDIYNQTLIKKNSKHISFDVFFSPAHRVPDIVLNNFKNIKVYTFIHDIIPFKLPEYFDNLEKGSSWNSVLIDCMKNRLQDKYFANSEFTKSDFLEFVPELHDTQIITTLLACDKSFKPCSVERTRIALKKYNLPINVKYVFSLCSLEPRKNLIRAIKSFIQFIKKNNINDMVFILGGGHWDEFIGKLKSEITDLGEYKDKIIRAGYIDDEDLAPLYSGAEWFVYTSQYEGFGLPPLEAMSCGCPVITSNNSSLPEVVGDAGIMIDWDSDDQHVSAYEKYYFDKDFKNQMSKLGIERAQKFSWKKCVDIMIKEFYKNDK